MKVIMGADHGGWKMKEGIKRWLKGRGYEVRDVGAVKERNDDDFVDYAVLVGKELESDSKARGILLCRSGQGMMIAANRFSKVRCGLGFSKKVVLKAREDDDINCLSIPADYLSLDAAKEMIEVFLTGKFSGKERFNRRLFKLDRVGRKGEERCKCGDGEC